MYPAPKQLLRLVYELSTVFFFLEDCQVFTWERNWTSYEVCTLRVYHCTVSKI